MNTKEDGMIYGIDGLMKFLHCSRTTATRVAKSKQFPRYQISGTRQIFFKQEEILSAIKIDDK